MKMGSPLCGLLERALVAGEVQATSARAVLPAVLRQVVDEVNDFDKGAEEDFDKGRGGLRGLQGLRGA